MNDYNFVSLDVETANTTQDSICQIGIHIYKEGIHTYKFQTLINPQEDFEAIHCRVHGINALMVEGQPLFPDVYPTLQNLLCGQVIAHYSMFDFHAIKKACMKYGLPAIESQWLDLSRVVRKAWDSPDYSLSTIAANLGFQYNEHDASEDALIAAKVLLQAHLATNKKLSYWLRWYSTPMTITPEEAAHFVNTDRARFNGKVARSGCGDGPLKGQVVVFTGNLSITRSEAAAMAAQAGCEVQDGFNKHTTMVVVGIQDLSLLAGHTKSSKQLKAEEAIAHGRNVCILSEDEFKKRVKGNA